MYDEMVAQMITSLSFEQLTVAEEAIKSRRSQLIQQRLLGIPLYANIRFRVQVMMGTTQSRIQTEGGLITSAPVNTRSGIVMRHLRRSVLLDVGEKKLRKVDFDDICWDDAILLQRGMASAKDG